MAPASDSPQVRFEGHTPGTEIWGVTQANFLIRLSGRHAKEAAVQLNLPAAKLLAEVTGREDGEEFREEAARAAGTAILGDLVIRGAQIDSLIVASRGFFDENPSIFEAVKASLS